MDPITIPSSIQKTLDKLKEVSLASPDKAIFLNRSIEGLISILEGENLVDVSSAPSNYEVLLAALSTPTALALLGLSNPLAQAQIRGLKLKQQLIETEGGCTDTSTIAKLLRITPQAVNKRRREEKLIGLSMGKGKYIYPLWQFTEGGETLSGLETVLNELKGVDSWTQIAFFLNESDRLQGKTPLSVLREGNVSSVVTCAIAFAHDEPD